MILEEVKTKAAKREEVKKSAGNILRWLSAALAGFCLSSVKIEGEVSPFSVALAAGACETYVLPSAVGGALGALVFFEPLAALKYAGTLTLVFIIRTAGEKHSLKGKEQLIYPLTAFFSLLVCSGLVSVFSGLTAAGLVVILCESLLAAGGSCFSRRLFTIFPGDIRGAGASAADTAAVLISGSVLLLSFDGFRISGFSPAHMLAFLLVMTLSLCSGGAVGCAAGICSGAILGFSPESTYLAFLLPAGGLLCAVVSAYGRFASSAAFFVLGALFIIVKGEADALFPMLAEVLGACLAFLLVPKKLMSRIESAVSPFTKEKYALDTALMLKSKLKRSAKAVRDISVYVRAASRLNVNAQNAPQQTAEMVKAEKCASCIKKDVCWGEYAKTTERQFLNTAQLLALKEDLSPGELPEHIRKVCRVPEELLFSFVKNYCEALAREGAANEISDVKTAAAELFENTAAILDDAALAAENTACADPYIGALAAEVFREQDFKVKTLTVSGAPGSKTFMEAFCSYIPPRPDYNLLLERLKQKTGVGFMPPAAEFSKNEGTALFFCEKPGLSARFHKLSSNASGERLCGDTAEAFSDGRGNLFLVLSDGMGSGKRAAIDSLLACSLFSRLMRAGFSPETAIRSVNGALLMKNSDETLATLDVLKIDLYTGRAVFYKAGASFSVLCRGGKTMLVERSSMPLGIMNETNFEKSESTLCRGDAAIITSDGAGMLTADFYKDLFSANKNADEIRLAQLIMKEAQKRAPIGKADDITVLCVKIV